MGPSAELLTASDLCDDVTVTFGEDTTAGDCPDAYTLTRTWKKGRGDMEEEIGRKKDEERGFFDLHRFS